MITNRTHSVGKSLKKPATAQSLVEPGKGLPPEFEALGSGYDLFDEYAYSGSIIAALFDWHRAKLIPRGNYQVPELITATRMASVDSHFYWGESSLKLQSSLSTSVSTGLSLPGLFSMTVSSEFSESTIRKSGYIYSLYQLVMPLWKFSFDYQSPEAKRLMNKRFKNALETYPTEKLFQNYGTHFLKDIIIGGRLHFSSATKSSYFKSETEFSISAKGSCELEMGTLDASASVTTRNSIESYNKNSETHLKSSGGDAASAAMIGTGTDPLQNKQFFQKWLESVEGDPVLTDFGSENSLVPIWELASSPARREALKVAADEYLKARDKEKRIYSDKLTAIQIVHGSNAIYQAPPGYTLIPYDLNRGARGDFIYLCTHTESARDIQTRQIQPIVELQVFDIHGVTPQMLQTWKMIPVDLNKGAGGADIFLFYRLGEPGQLEGAIRDVAVVGGSGGYQPAPYGYTQIPFDVNLRAGGDFIYICYAKED